MAEHGEAAGHRASPYRGVRPHDSQQMLLTCIQTHARIPSRCVPVVVLQQSGDFKVWQHCGAPEASICAWNNKFHKKRGQQLSVVFLPGFICCRGRRKCWMKPQRNLKLEKLICIIRLLICMGLLKNITKKNNPWLSPPRPARTDERREMRRTWMPGTEDACLTLHICWLS